MKKPVARSLIALAALALFAAGASRGAPPVRVAFVVDVLTLNDPHDFRALAYRGFVRAVKDFSVQGMAVQSNPKLGPAPTLARLGRERYDLVFTGEMKATDFLAVSRVVRKFPRTTFVAPDFSYGLLGKAKNVQGADWRVAEPSYLAGYLAGLLERQRSGPDVVGSVGGSPIPPVDRYIAGFEAGARRADPGIRTLRGYTNDFLNPSKCRTIALSQIARGAGVVFNVAGLCGLGTLAAAKSRRVWGVGVDVDQSYLGSQVLTSVLERRDVQVYDTIGALVHGTLRAGEDAVWDLGNHAVGLGNISPEVPPAFLRRLDRIRAEIVAGKITVPATLPRR